MKNFFAGATPALFLFLASTANAVMYYINGASGDDANPGTIGSPWKTIHKANITLVAGDTVFFRGGMSDYQVYRIGEIDTIDEGIHPANSGADAEHRITFATWQNEKVELVGISSSSYYTFGIHIVGKNYIKVTGYDGSSSSKNMKFTNLTAFLKISDGLTWPDATSGLFGNGGNYNEISYLEFTQTNDVMTGSPLIIHHNSSYNWLHHCKIYKMGGYDEIYDKSSCLDLGWEDCGLTTNNICTDYSSNNVIENNDMFHGGHQVILLLNNKNVLRNNTLHNEQWYHATDGIWYGYRVIQMQGVKNRDYHHGYNLIESNRISHAANNMNGSLGGEGIHLGTSNNVIRHNDIYANGGNAIYMENHELTDGGRINYNHIYNNTFFANGYECTYPNAYKPLIPPNNWMSTPPDRNPIYFVSGPSDSVFVTSLYGNVIKNNIFWKGTGDFVVSGRSEPYFGNCAGYTVCGNTVLEPNFIDVNPNFMDEGDYKNPAINSTDVEWYWPRTPDGSDITKINTEPNFDLQSGSPAIDGGTSLTTATNSGPSATLAVADAKYFQPGWGKWTGGGGPDVQADWIAIGTINNTVQISSIDYENKTITLASPMTWSNGDPVWLYKKSDGAVVLTGSAPDYGAHEYGTGTPTIKTPARPRGLRVR